jgi:hypothetical protein
MVQLINYVKQIKYIEIWEAFFNGINPLVRRGRVRR